MQIICAFFNFRSPREFHLAETSSLSSHFNIHLICCHFIPRLAGTRHFGDRKQLQGVVGWSVHKHSGDGFLILSDGLKIKWVHIQLKGGRVWRRVGGFKRRECITVPNLKVKPFAQLFCNSKLYIYEKKEQVWLDFLQNPLENFPLDFCLPYPFAKFSLQLFSATPFFFNLKPSIDFIFVTTVGVRYIFSIARTCASVYVCGRAGYGCDPVVWCSWISRRGVPDGGRRPPVSLSRSGHFSGVSSLFSPLILIW